MRDRINITKYDRPIGKVELQTNLRQKVKLHY
jgi:hypothetical protein